MKGLKLFAILMAVIVITMGVVYITQNTQTSNKVIIQVTSQQFKFTPNMINVTYGTDVILNITSLDVTHGFQIDEYHIYNKVVPAGESIQVEFVANIRGQFKFYCTVLCGTGHADHLGTLVVT